MNIQRSLNEVVFFLIEQTNKKAKQFSAAKFAERGIDVTVDQWVLMKVIQENPDQSQSAIAEQTYKDAASITRMLDLLVKKDLVYRMPIDRRQFSINLTEKGQGFIEKHMTFVQELRNIGTAGLSEEEIAGLRRILLKIQENLK